MKIKTITLAGVYYSWARRQKMQVHLSVGDMVAIQRQPDNPIDKNAVIVCHEESGCIGWIPKDYAAKLSPWLITHKAKAKISDMDLGEVPPRITIQVWADK